MNWSGLVNRSSARRKGESLFSTTNLLTGNRLVLYCLSPTHKDPVSTKQLALEKASIDLISGTPPHVVHGGQAGSGVHSPSLALVDR